MKSFLAVALVVAYFAYAQALPSLPRDEDEIALIFPAGSSGHFGMHPYDSSESDERGEWGSTFYNPFRRIPVDSFMSGIESALTRFRNHLTNVFAGIPDMSFGGWTKVPDGANTTSTTKIIDGHVVTINETTYVNNGDELGTMIRVRVIDVKPQNETLPESEDGAEATTVPTAVTEAEESTTPARSVETVEEFDNEIPKNQVDTLTA